MVLRLDQFLDQIRHDHSHHQLPETHSVHFTFVSANVPVTQLPFADESFSANSSSLLQLSL